MILSNQIIDKSKWQRDSETEHCTICLTKIQPSLFKSNKHHCRYCGKIVCSCCSDNSFNRNRICDICIDDKQQTKNALLKLSKIPYSFSSSVSDPMMINNNQFLFYTTYKTSKHGIYCYNVTCDKWTSVHHKSTNIPCDIICAAYNHTSTHKEAIQIYGVNENSQLIKHVIKNNKLLYTSEVKTSISIGRGANCKFIDDKFHIIGGNYNNKHFVWNESYRFFQSDIGYVRCLNSHSHNYLNPGLIYLPTKKSLFVFGGNGGEVGNNAYSNQIWKYYLTSKNEWQWEALRKMPSNLSNCGIVSCKDDTYILIFGGKTTVHQIVEHVKGIPRYEWKKENSSKIYVFDVTKQRSFCSQVESPIKGPCKAFNPNNYYFGLADLTNAYVHHYTKCMNVGHDVLSLISKFVGQENITYSDNNVSVKYKTDLLMYGYLYQVIKHKYIPSIIANLIETFTGLVHEYVHVIGYESSARQHWKIDVDYILDNLEKKKNRKRRCT
eukprot:469338_1